MPTYALTDEGLQIETWEETRDSMVEERRGQVGKAADLSDGSIEGQWIANVANRIASVGELLETIYNATDPDAATGSRQDQLYALAGSQRLAATPSRTNLVLVGDDGTEVQGESSRAGIPDGGAQFAILETVTLALLDAWAAAMAYVLGDRVSNGADRAYECIDPGTSAGSGGPTGNDFDVDIVDGSVLWRYVGEGLAAAEAVGICTANGPTVATAGAITEIVTPVTGWNSVVNVLDADLGRNDETSEAFRVRRIVDLASAGTGTVDALRAKLRAVPGVTAAEVFRNTTEETDADGLPPHSVECLVLGGDDQAILDCIHANVGATATTYGDETGEVTDSAGNVLTYSFSRPAELLVYVTAHLTIDPRTYPLDGDDQAKAAIVLRGDGLPGGTDIVARSLMAPLFAIPGVLNVPTFNIRTAPTPISEATIAVGLRQIAVYDTSRIIIATTEGTP